MRHRPAIGLLLLTLTLAACSDDNGPPPAASKPNILYIVMDDVGIDQMRLFGYGGVTPPSTANIDAIAAAGVKFHNTWAMPACSTSRAVFFEGRYPFRTNVLGALGPDDLANSMVSPYETTAPKLLAQQGYESGLFGKFHLGLQGHDPAGYAMPYNLGWNYFAGFLDETGDPSSIDKTAGGVAEDGITYSCGFVPGADQTGGADEGACYKPDGTCTDLSSSGSTPPGRICRDDGGIFDPNKPCSGIPGQVPSYVNFETLSGHYVSPFVINYPDGAVYRAPATDPRARTFRAKVVVDEAAEWIKSRPAGTPWMASVTFSSAHTPVMQPPPDELPDYDPADNELDCSNPNDQRVLTNEMIESLDFEVGRLLVETGLATRGSDGALVYQPEKTNTMIVVVGDNGTLGGVVKVPFDPLRAKGTAYQTGVWVPLVVSGPLVKSPDRTVDHMVNIADLYELFGEIAGIDVHAAVPRAIDSHSMLPYLTNPEQTSIRTSNFTQVGTNLQANGAINGPCTISTTCTQIPVTKSVCEDNNGIWWGDGATDPITGGGGFQYCCQVVDYSLQHGGIRYEIAPLGALAIRNDRYKIVQNMTKEYVSQANPCVDLPITEFYPIDEDVPVPTLDEAGDDLLPRGLTPEQQANYDALSAELEALLASNQVCTGDGNIDGVVDQRDLDDWEIYAAPSYGQSSVYDINIDGLTNPADQQLIQDNLGTTCPGN